MGHIRFTVAFCSQVEIWQGLREVARTTADLLIPSRLAAIWPDVSKGILTKNLSQHPLLEAQHLNAEDRSSQSIILRRPEP